MKYVIANWKSNKSKDQAQQWFEQFAQVLSVDHEVKIIIAPPFPFLDFVSQFLRNMLNDEQRKRCHLAVQDLSSFPAGSYTGAISAVNLEGFEVTYAILGHSERRAYFHETHQDVANKVTQALENGMKPILCVDKEYVTQQAQALESSQLEKCLVAFEDLNSIGNDKPQPVESVEKVFTEIKDVFGNVSVLYGGSVKPANCSDYFSISDGVLLGGASLQPDTFIDIIKKAQ